MVNQGVLLLSLEGFDKGTQSPIFIPPMRRRVISNDKEERKE